MIRRILFFGLLFSLIFGTLAEARVYLDINAPTFTQIPIVLPKWKSIEKTPPAFAAKVYEILSNAPTLSVFFRVIDPRRLPASLQQKEGIPDQLLLQEWESAGGEILLAGEAFLDPEARSLR